MRTTRRLAVVSAVLGGGLLLAGPAAAQTAVDCDEYGPSPSARSAVDLGGPATVARTRTRTPAAGGAATRGSPVALPPSRSPVARSR